ncbi:thymidylate synthase [Mycobacterium phage Artemis2UCLA]|uniref:ThyX-like thymidylate synthase n=1 Tax=Mycobacterium phage Gruunaga TaxID=1897770 RepID=A0A1C9LYV1_9CAUD|nr:thymidylate synthase [Mycobacterium phage Artemis2UCLA]AHB29944.1 ThyX-like thymidylate synthase [Mycobacterium phage Artemis2UCLA]AOQ28065.1 ThyX-like thymidylate synthase [Mycobacterium phage Gruunaga]
MKAKLIAATQIDADALRGIGYEPHPYVVNDDNGEFGDYDHDELAEFAGRNCYRSFHRPNPATRENEDYLAHILEVGHESVLEHASATFYIETSRSVLTELERHRHLSFSVVSQRYVDPTELGVHVPPAIQECMGEIPGEILRDAVEYAVGSYEAIVSYLSGVRGLPRKQAREAARAVLPNMTNSPMVVTGNHRAWRYVIKNRWHEAADAEIRELAGELLRQLREIAPNTYQDIPSEPYSYGG